MLYLDLIWLYVLVSKLWLVPLKRPFKTHRKKSTGLNGNNKVIIDMIY